MNITHPLVIAVSFIVSGQMASAPDLSRYRTYALGSSVEAVVVASGARPADVKTLHERPATIQLLEWRAPYVSSSVPLADPVRDIAFTFHDDALYRIVVTYDRDRTEGLTASDIVDALSATYGAPAPQQAGGRPDPSAEAFPDSVVLARWDTDASRLTLVRGMFTPGFQLVLMSKALSVRAQGAIREAIRLDVIDAPRLASEQRKQEADDARTDRDKTRLTNQTAFRP